MNSKELLTRASFFQNLATRKLAQTAPPAQSLPTPPHAVPGSADKNVQVDPVTEAVTALLAPYRYTLSGNAQKLDAQKQYQLKINAPAGDSSGPPGIMNFLTKKLHESGKLPSDWTLTGMVQFG